MDEVMGDDLDWRRTVRSYPLPALLVAALGGFFLGRRYGWQLIDDLSAFAADQLVGHLEEVLESGPPNDRR